MDSYWYCLLSLLLVRLSCGQPRTSLPSVEGRIYETIRGTVPCFRLTNATHQIGCSGSASDQRGVIEYIDSDCNFNKLLNTGPTPPYVAIMELECFSLDNIIRLQSSPRVNGIVLRLENITDLSPFPGGRFSPERSCPSDGFANSSCSRPWNPNATDLLFHDFGDLPIMIVPDDQFQIMLDCYDLYNAKATSGSVGEYPLCSAQLTADMYLAKDTATCFRRQNLPINYLNGVSFCNPLGGHNVWGTPFELKNASNGIIMLSTKLDGVSFFLESFSYGADSEVAGIAVLLAVIEQLGSLQQRRDLLRTETPIMYTFFNGESWDYIGSSRMVYDMLQEKFPYPLQGNIPRQLPLIRVGDVSTMIELSQLGITGTDSGGNATLFLHGTTGGTVLTNTLTQRLSQVGVSLSPASGRPPTELPPASLNWFRQVKTGGEGFESFVLAGFNEEFNNRFFGSLYDDLRNLIGRSSLKSVADKLANIATALTQAVLTAAGPVCSEGVNCVDLVSANSTLIEELLTCFLVNSNCSLFRSVTSPPFRAQLTEAPLERYVTVSVDRGTFNLYTSVVFQLAAFFSAYNKVLGTLDECLGSVNGSDQVVNRTAIPVNETHYYCVESYTYLHKAQSPAFDFNDYASTEYSTWVESRWDAVQIRIYLTAHSTTEVGVLMGGLAMTLITLLVAIQCIRRSDKLFKSPVRYDPYHVS